MANESESARNAALLIAGAGLHGHAGTDSMHDGNEDAAENGVILPSATSGY
jgi:hypothetical protein